MKTRHSAPFKYQMKNGNESNAGPTRSGENPQGPSHQDLSIKVLYKVKMFPFEKELMKLDLHVLVTIYYIKYCAIGK